ncbi:aminopeptidase P family protein [Nocardia asteroides NBRC 15531]|uniref:Xaa-Pro dipeptidase n=1 Tax=Nocardia asteroides NBRC 15531 TaxID=1110697 RepID=U5EEJ0_NOCAS|nr:Xaa-Pro peptidase family protein [Nocardia asteroides]TLF67468.1 aminopeptidase P family protein [Nocardia asteroides NBRC 15531]UGT51038.1 Xaa-Pro peptidase family protein [Nocardia asteroides]SFN40780.1 Xaa-Pro aminopeptidase [Nocardia asteroides]VEG36097.1 Xaa-Pro dipeptidase [Nocardia asteroides]GAD85740.1 Xaa-Pro dipeptidase [Nocardia asteroides NBRC 15531]
MSAHTDARFAADVYGERLERAVELMRAAHLDALLITPGPDLRYLIGSAAESFERLTCLVIPADGATPSVVIPKLELASLDGSAAGELGLQILDWVDGVDPYQLVRSTLHAGSRIAVADAMPALHLIPLAESTSGLPASATPVLRQARMIKGEAEIEALRRAGAAIDRVHARMGEFLRVGRTEAEVGADIAAAIVEEGHTEAAFVIVGSGPHGADPHHGVSDRVIEPGDVVVIDIGGPVEPGYYSDSTRTYVLGSPGKQVAERMALLEAAQAAAVAAVRPGVTAESIDAAARTVLAEAGLGDAFVHRTGHGIGLSVHEEPYIVAGNDLVLEPGMAFSIEPGIYFRGRWGARIEDIVVVTADGAESMNNRPHGLTVL